MAQAQDVPWTADPTKRGPQHLFRVGPTNPDTGYPFWYEDKAGVRLGLCTDPDLCFLETPDPLQPLVFPTNFPDEIFYFAAESLIMGSPDSGIRAIVVQAIEGAFFNEAAIPGDNTVFSRIRIRIDNLVEGRQYKVTYPYGVHVFEAEADAGPGTVAGPGLSITHDIGISEPLEFTGAVNGDIGPFLTTVAPGAPGFISPDLGGHAITGSPYGTNFFRIEGTDIGLDYGPEFTCSDPALGPNPTGTDDCIQSNLFSVMGQYATRFGVDPTRATFSKEIDAATNTERTFVNIWASSVEGQTIVASVDGSIPETMTEGQLGNYFLRVEVPDSPPNQHPLTVELVNNSDSPVSVKHIDITDSVNITSATYTIGTGLQVTTESSNQVDAAGGHALLLNGIDNTRTAVLGDSGSGTATGNYGASLDEVSPTTVQVTSRWGGTSESSVKIEGAATGGAQVNLLVANAGPDQSVLGDGTTVNLNGADSLGPLDMTYSWAMNDPSNSVAFVNSNSGSVSFQTPIAPIPGGFVAVTFTLTVNDPTLLTTSTDSMTVNITQPGGLPTDDCSNVLAAVYIDNKEKWKTEGTCTLVDNQVLKVYLGDAIGPITLIGSTNVDEIGEWKVRTDNGSATEVGTVPNPALHDRIWVISSRGGIEGSLPYTIK